jgi:hypothetical protein
LDLLAQSAESITYQDVQDFCDQKVGETTVVDYKKELPRDLAKHIAAMSNRYGGLIIVGVEEDPQTGTPRVYEGLVNDGKLVERGNQFAYNVRPLPSCLVRTTDEVNGKVFLLVRVSEGGSPPYTTVSDPTIYLRTGNVTTPLRPADAEIVRDLHAKRDLAVTLQSQNVARANARLRAVIERQDAETVRLVKQQQESSNLLAAPEGLMADNLRLLTAYLQPFYPRYELAAPRVIEAKLKDLRLQRATGPFFPGTQMSPIARGMMSVQASTKYFRFACQQLYANGLFHHAENTVRPNSGTVTALYLEDIARVFYLTMLFSRRLYAQFGYQGLVRGSLALANARGRSVHIIPLAQRPYDSTFPGDRPVTIDDDYDWPIEADTHQLNDDDWLKRYFKDQMREIYWDLGYNDIRADVLDIFISRLGVEEQTAAR